MRRDTGHENGGSSWRRIFCKIEIQELGELTLRRREDLRWQEERVSRLIREIRDMEAVHLLFKCNTMRRVMFAMIDNDQIIPPWE